jgi:hypothetical protein
MVNRVYGLKTLNFRLRRWLENNPPSEMAAKMA